MSFADCSALEGKGGDRGTWYVANRFRGALKQLADVFRRKGNGRPVPEDAYKAAAVDPPGREAAAATRSVPERAKLIAEAAILEARVARMGLND